MLNKFTFEEVESSCKHKLTTLEHWLRRLIDDTLSNEFGDYFHYTDEKGNYIIKKSITESAVQRKQREPDRYSRLIDAILLDDAISIVTNPRLYTAHFSKAFKYAFPNGCNEAKTFLKRISEPRNNLAHANPISVRQAEQILCYSNDVIDSLKEYYREINMQKDFNVPTVLSIRDSVGNSKSGHHLRGNDDNNIWVFFNEDPNRYLNVGDTLRIEVEIDQSFHEDEYSIEWSSNTPWYEKNPTGKSVEIKLTEKQVSQKFLVVCKVTSNKAWHKLGDKDDELDILYTVLPPR
ncbi:hypothetical protein ACRTD6_22950 [Vibrio parahaemolyticus]|uniref:hypothetical protein n=1 Tax=Vibrio parahaemolyticus TaxID=670 RepID=UPI003D7E641B